MGAQNFQIMGTPKALPEESTANPYSGYLEVESYWYSLDGSTWELGNKFYPGTRLWAFKDMENTHDPEGNPAFTGNLYGYESVRVNYKVEFTWYPAREELYIDQSVESHKGVTDIHNETFRVGLTPDGRAELSRYEDGAPEEKWVLIYRR